jgi:SAM-dependent methyltransferase
VTQSRVPGPGRPLYPEALESLGAVQHFADPALYDATYQRRVHDLPSYVSRAAAAGRVVELGCGSGRITIPMAQAGARVTAVDRSPAMLSALQRALASAPPEVAARVDAHEADLRTFSLGERVPLVTCPFNTFLHLYTRDDVARALTAVRELMLPTGRFVFDTSLPRPQDLRDRKARGRRVRFEGRIWRYDEEFQWEPLEQILYVTLTWTPADGGVAIQQLLAHRQFFAAELEALLFLHGFEAEVSEWDGPLSRDPDALLWSCRVR